VSSPSSVLSQQKPRTRWRRPGVLPGFTLSFGLSTLFVSLIVLIPLIALVLTAANLDAAQYWESISDPRVVATYKVTASAALWAAAINTVLGMLLAWILVRYEFPGRRLLDALVDIPFALPTAVAGFALAGLFAANGWFGQWLAPLGWRIAYAYPGIVVAMVMTSLPFVVRTVQPVLEDLSAECEEAALTLGASPRQIFRRITLPTVAPALITGAGLAFTRSLGEFGAIIFIAGNLPYATEVTSLIIFVRLQEYNQPAAAAIASVILGASLSLLILLQWLQRRWLQAGAP